MAEGQVAVLIDVENVGLSPVQELFDQLANVGRIIVKRAYGDWSGTRARDRDRLQALGIEPIHVFHSATGKNSADIRLAIDAIELSFQSPVDTFVVVSSDSDFVPLVGKLRAAGKTVIGAGPSAVASRTLVGSCDRYFYLDPKAAPATAAAPDEVQDVGLLARGVRASMDDDGYVGIVGRIKDMIIRGGENVYPREIEEFLYTHPDVADAQVIGVPSARYGEEVMAWVKPKPNASVDAKGLTAFCRGTIATYKIPRYWKIVDAFPMTVTGKVQKYLMREISTRELGLTPAPDNAHTEDEQT